MEQVHHLTRWVWVCANLICSKIASIMPNLAYVVDTPKRGVTVKAGQRGLLNLMDRGFGGSTDVGGSYDYRLKSVINGAAYDYSHDWRDVSKQPYHAATFHPLAPSTGGQEIGFSDGGHSWLTMGEYRSKSLSVVKPHEELEPLESDHPLRRLVENPNPVDTHYDIEYELWMFELLCGVSYEWIIPNDYGRPCERWCIPSHWVWPRTGGGKYLSPDLLDEYPHADELIQYYEIRPWGGMGSAGVLRFPPNEVIMRINKSPISKLDGYSPLAAMAQWIDLDESISKSRWAQMMNQARPELWIELGPGYEDPTDDRIARVEAKIASRFQGEYNYGKPIVTPPGAKLTPLSYSPDKMAYGDGSDQTRDMLLSGFLVPPAAVGLSKEMTFGSILATLGALCAFNFNPKLASSGQTKTKHLCSHFDERTPAYSTMAGGGHGGRAGRRQVRYWHDDCVPADPQQVNSDIQADLGGYAITPNEIRALRGRKPYKQGGDDPMGPGPGGTVPIPLNTGDSLEALAQQLAPMAEMGKEEEAGQGAGAAASGEGLSEGGAPVNRLPSAAEGEAPEMDFGSAGIAEPNGPPTKSAKALGYGIRGDCVWVELLSGDYAGSMSTLVRVAQDNGLSLLRGEVLGEARRRLFTSRGWRVVRDLPGWDVDGKSQKRYLIEYEVPGSGPTKYWTNGRSRDKQLVW